MTLCCIMNHDGQREYSKWHGGMRCSNKRRPHGAPFLCSNAQPSVLILIVMLTVRATAATMPHVVLHGQHGGVKVTSSRV